MILTGSRCRYPELARKSRLLWPVANCTSQLFPVMSSIFPAEYLYIQESDQRDFSIPTIPLVAVLRVWDEIRQDLWSHLQIEDRLVSWGEAHHAIPGALLDT